MARLPRLIVPGVPLFVVQRVRPGELLARDAAGRDALEDFLRRAARSHGLSLHGYVVLADRFELLATPPTPSAVARALQSVGRRFVQQTNRDQTRVGGLWEGRFRSTVVEPAAGYLLLLRAMELAPVEAGLVEEPGQYPWSSYRHHVGLAPLEWISDHAEYWRLGNTPFERHASYRTLAASPLSGAERALVERARQGGWALGSALFIDEIEAASGRRAAPLPRGRPRADDSVPK